MGEYADLDTLFTAMADTARDLSERPYVDENELLNAVTVDAVEQIPGALCAAITLVEKLEVNSVAPTDPVAARVDELQRSAGEGPAVSAADEWSDHIVDIEDYQTETRWPRYVSSALAETPVRATVAFQLYRNTKSMGALCVHSDQPGAFTAEAREIGLAVATHAALALYAARREDQFASALASRDTIGQAKGLVMERFKINAIQAWELLRKLSQDDNIPVHILAQHLINSDARTAVTPHTATRPH